ncbi:MAG: SDR family oxidoreductase [Pirellulales bacterium]|nr:SDR family oxidoreductase [Pirellulales bacterium]
MAPLTGKTVLITGGGSGIGLATALAFAEQGCRVAIGGRDAEKLRQAATIWTGQPGILHHIVNVADRASVQTFVDWAMAQLGQIDILVNGAGTNIKLRTMREMPPAQWDELLAINATGAYNMLYAVLPDMRARQDGLVINISSVAGLRALRLGGVAYCASKFAMTALGTAVGNEECVNNIRVTNIYPGEVDTPILQNRPTPVTPEHKARILQAADVAAAAVFVASLPSRAHVPDLVIKPLSQEFC